MTDEQWETTFNINVIGRYLVADESRALWAGQGLRGSMVLTTSVNAFVSKKGSLAYDSSKAAANHLMRELAVELAPLVRVNARRARYGRGRLAMFPRDRVIASLVKYDILFEEEESTDSSAPKLAQFYAKTDADQIRRSRRQIRPKRSSTASERSSKVTGQVVPVDGGLQDAFVR